jgi:hypothetical protein
MCNLFVYEGVDTILTTTTESPKSKDKPNGQPAPTKAGPFQGETLTIIGKEQDNFLRAFLQR